MNQLEQLTKLQRKQEESQPFSENDKKILKQLSQCNSSYYKAKIIDMLIYELEDWSYEILKVMVKDQDRLVAEMAVRSLANFIKAKDFANLLEEFEECTDFIKYDIVDMIGYIGFKRKLSDDVIKERMQEILSKLKKDSRAVYSTYAELYYVTKEEKYIYKILKDLKSKDEDIRHHILYTIDGIIIENNLKSKKLLNDHKQLLQKMEQKLYVNMEYEERYNHIFRERLIRSIRKTLGKSTEIIYPKERNFYEQIPDDLEHILQRCIFELYYPIHDDRQEIVLNLLKENKDKIKDESFYIFGSYIESLYGNDDVNVYQEWLEENGSRENEAIILYLRAVWEVASSDYEVSNKRALRYAKKALKCAKAFFKRKNHESKRLVIFGAGEGNRTLVSSLEGWCSTIELRPRTSICYHSRRLMSTVLLRHSTTIVTPLLALSRSWSRRRSSQRAKARLVASSKMEKRSPGI